MKIRIIQKIVKEKRENIKKGILPDVTRAMPTAMKRREQKRREENRKYENRKVKMGETLVLPQGSKECEVAELRKRRAAMRGEKRVEERREDERSFRVSGKSERVTCQRLFQMIY